jgi:hypothetical protein
VFYHNESILLVNRLSKSRPFTATHSTQEDRAIGVSSIFLRISRTPEAIMVHWFALEFVVQQMNGAACTISRVWPQGSWLDTGLDTGLPFSASGSTLTAHQDQSSLKSCFLRVDFGEHDAPHMPPANKHYVFLIVNLYSACAWRPSFCNDWMMLLVSLWSLSKVIARLGA